MSFKSESSEVKMAEKITLSFLTKFIKTYNGDRESLPAFLTNCDNAMSLASPDQQLILCKFIVSQLEGKAQIACSLKTFSNWIELKTFLRSTFGEKKHATHLLSDLQHAKQLTNEDVTKYSLRIENILTRIHSDIHYSCKDEKELPGRIAAMEDLALNSFLLGLNPSISTIVRCKNPLTLSDAVQYATDEEKLYNLSKTYAKSQKQCSICNKTGHSSSECYKNKKPNFSQKSYHINPQGYQNNNSNNFNKRSCNYCKRLGHTIEECRRRQYNNQRREHSNHLKPEQNSTNSLQKINMCECQSNDEDNIDQNENDLN